MVNLVVALQCEAKPLIARYRLRGRSKGPFRLYESERVRLVVSGVGKVAAAAATAYGATLGETSLGTTWLNVGVAGHGSADVGEGFLANKITDTATGKRYYPPQVFAPPCASAALRCVDQPAQDYESGLLQDMEASAFYDTACRFTTSELVQCFKVVSDNPAAPATHVTERQVQGLIEAHLDAIDAIIQGLRPLAQALTVGQTAEPLVNRFLAQWRFTAYQRNRLHRLLQRWRALTGEDCPWQAEWESLPNAQRVLDRLQAQVDALPVRFGDGVGK